MPSVLGGKYCNSNKTNSHSNQKHLNYNTYLPKTEGIMGSGASREFPNYVSVPANNNLKSRLGVRKCSKYGNWAPSLDFRLLFAGTEALFVSGPFSLCAQYYVQCCIVWPALDGYVRILAQTESIMGYQIKGELRIAELENLQRNRANQSVSCHFITLCVLC